MRVWDKVHKGTPSYDAEPKVWSAITGSFRSGEAALDRSITAGNLLNPVLVELPISPGSFYHLADLPSEPLQQAFFKRTLRNRQLVLWIAVVYALCSVVIYSLLPALQAPALFLGVGCAFVACYLLIDRNITFRNIESFAERGRYYGWLFVNGRPYVRTSIVFFLTVGFVQFILGGPDFLKNWGLLYQLAGAEPWRIMTGSMIHSSVAHWLTNASIGVGIAALAGPSLKHFFAPVFLIGGIFAFLTTYFWQSYMPGSTDGLVGTSGGLAALIGGLTAMAIRFRNSYPKHFYFTLGFLFLISFLLGAAFFINTSVVCHLSGALTGACIALALPDYLTESQ